MATAPKPNIAQRINTVQQKVSYIQKEDKAGMRFKIVSHDSVTALVRPHLVEAGVLYYPRNLHTQIDGNRVEATFDVRFENIDDRSDFIDVATFGFGIDPQDKGPGKAISYGVKYALLKCLGLETGDDPDNESINHRSRSHEAADALDIDIAQCLTIEQLAELMAEANTKVVMADLAKRDPGRRAQLAGAMSKRAKELKG